MRAVLVVLSLAVAGFLAWVAWQSHIEALRRVATEEWIAPAQLWTCIGDSLTFAEMPGGTPIDLDVLWKGGLCANEEPEPQRIEVAPHAREAAREELGISRSDDSPEYVLTRESRKVAGREWHRWDLLPRDFR